MFACSAVVGDLSHGTRAASANDDDLLKHLANVQWLSARLREHMVRGQCQLSRPVFMQCIIRHAACKLVKVSVACDDSALSCVSDIGMSSRSCCLDRLYMTLEIIRA